MHRPCSLAGVFLLAALAAGCTTYRDYVTDATIEDHEETIRHLEAMLAARGGDDSAALRAEIERLRRELERLRASRVGPGGPVVWVEGPGTLDSGVEAPWRVTVTNPANQAAAGVEAVCRVPEGLEFVAATGGGAFDGESRSVRWSIGNLGPGESWAQEVRLAVRRTGAYQVCAEATGRWVHCQEGVSVQPAIACRLEAPSQAMAGRPFPLVVVLENPGSGTARQIQAVLELDGLDLASETGAREWRVQEITAGQASRQTWNLVAPRPGRGTVVVHLRAAGDLTGVCRAEVDVVAPGLEISKTGPGARYAGQEAEFRIEVVNPGNAPSTGVQVVDPVPPGFQFVRAGEGGRHEGGAVHWDLGTLAPGDRREVSLVLRPMREGDHVNVARARSAEGLQAEASAPIKVLEVAALQLTVVDSDDPIAVGEETIYTVTVGNEGRREATGIGMRVRVPEEMTLVRAEGPTPHQIDPATGEVVFEPVAVLQAGQEVGYRLRVRAEAEGSAVCQALLRWNEFTREVRSEEGTTIYP